MVLKKRILIIAGPNGSGKTSFAKEFLPNEAGCPVFVNADMIAEGLSPFQPSLANFMAGLLCEVGLFVAGYAEDCSGSDQAESRGRGARRARRDCPPEISLGMA